MREATALLATLLALLASATAVTGDCMLAVSVGGSTRGPTALLATLLALLASATAKARTAVSEAVG